MSNSTNSGSEQGIFSPEDLEQFIQKQYPDHLRTWLKKNDPELYLILISNIIPKCQQEFSLQQKLTKKENDLDQLKDELKEAEIHVAEKQAALRFWEGGSLVLFPEINLSWFGGNFTLKTGGWKIKTGEFFNIVWDWLLKLGLSIVPILSLFSIFTIRDLENIDLGDLRVSISILSGISLVWLTSATICNWIITKEKFSYNFTPPSSKQNEPWWKFPALREKYIINRIVDYFTNDPDILIFFLIWLLEAVIGWATIPILINSAIYQINVNTGQELEYLGFWEKLEILFGVSIFAFVNILFAIAKGRIYVFNTNRKIELGKAISERDTINRFIQTCLEEIAELKAKIEHLEAQLKPEYLIKKFHDQIDNLSIWSRQGKDYTDIEEASNHPSSSPPVVHPSPLTTNSHGVSGNSSSPVPPI
jgi:hypothetical protein